jgi:hypothetical protein
MKVLVIGIVASIIVVLGGFTSYIMGRGKTHMNGLDFSNYNYWLLFFSAVMLFGLLLFLALWKVAKPIGKPKKIVYKPFYYIGIALFFFGVVWCSTAFISVLRGWNENAQTADIAISDGTSGDFLITDANVESNRDLDNTVYKWTRFISFDDRYSIQVDINCTNFANNTQLYNSTTATLQGYNILGNSVTSSIAPKTQPGSFTEADGAITVIFDGIPRQADSPNKAIVRFNLTLLDSNGVLLASWSISTDPRLGEWSLAGA